MQGLAAKRKIPAMKYYKYNGKIFWSHNKETLVRRLFHPTLNNWGELKIHKMDQLKKLLIVIKRGGK